MSSKNNDSFFFLNAKKLEKKEIIFLECEQARKTRKLIFLNVKKGGKIRKLFFCNVNKIEEQGN